MKDALEAALTDASAMLPAPGPTGPVDAAPVDIVIADQRQLICEGLRQLLCERPGIHVCTVARSRATLFDALRTCLPRVLVLNPRLDPDGGVRLLHALRDAWPCLPVLVLASDAETEDPVALVRAGARGYLSRDHGAADLVHAVHRIAHGGLFVSRELGESLAAALARGHRHESHAALSPREAEVFGYLARGHTVSQIARVLSVSVKTISTHKTRLMGRLGLGTLSELIQYAISHGLIQGGLLQGAGAEDRCDVPRPWGHTAGVAVADRGAIKAA